MPRRRNWSPVCVPAGIFTLALRAVDRRHLDVAAQRGLRHAQRHAAEDVGAVALEDRVRPDRDMHVQIAGRRARAAGLALAGQADAGAVLDAGGDRHLQACVRAARCRRPGRCGRDCGSPGPRRRRSGRCARSGRSPAARAPCRRRWQVGQVSAARPLSSEPVPLQASQATRVGTRSVDLGAGEGLGQVDFDRLAQIGAACGRAAAAAAPPMKSPNIWSKMSPRPPPAAKSKPPAPPRRRPARTRRGRTGHRRRASGRPSGCRRLR